MAASLLGRAAERAALASHLDALRHGIGGSVLVSAAAGLGKSALLDDLVDSAPSDVTVLRSAADPFECDRPLGLLLDALGSHRAPGQTPGGLRDRLQAAIATAGESRHHAVDAAIVLLESLATAQPLLLALDDLQWADPVSVMTMIRVVRRRPQDAILVVAALRSGDHPAETARFVDLVRAGGAPALSPAALHEADVAELTRVTLGAPPGRDLALLLQRAGGNPFLVTELLLALRRERRVVVRDGRVEVDAAGLPASYGEDVIRLLRSMGPAVERLVEHVALLGGRGSMRDIAAVLGSEAAAVEPAARAAVDAGLLVEADGELAFRHDLVREAVYGARPHQARVQGHTLAMRALGGAGAPSAAIAPHATVVAAHGQPGPSAEAVAWLRSASRDVLAIAPTIAVRHLETAVACAAGDAALAGIQAELAEALAAAGRVAEAQALADRLEGVAGADVLARARRTSAFVLRMLGRFAAARDVLRPLARQAAKPDAASITAELALLDLLVGDVEAAIEGASLALDLAQTGKDRLARAVADAVGSRGAWARGELTVATGQLADAVAHGLAEPDPLASMMAPAFQLGLDLVCLDRYKEAERLRRSVIERAEAGASPWWAYLGHLLAVSIHDGTGDWDDALAEAEAGRQVARDHEYGYGQLVLRSVASRICARRGNTSAARRWLEHAERQVVVGGPNMSAPLVGWARGVLQLHEGDAHGAVLTLAEAEAGLCRSPWWVRQPFLVADLAEAAVDCGRQQEVVAAVQRADGVAAAVGAASARMHAAVAAALALTSPDAVDRAKMSCRTSGLPPRMVALAGVRLGLTLAREGRLDEAAPLLSGALPALREMGATPLASRAADALAGTGAGDRRVLDALSGWQAITPSERRVADLVVAGLSNPEIATQLFVSRNTVQTHLSHIYSKLGLRSRTELTAALMRARSAGGDAPPWRADPA